ncbi:dTDP-4-dehydrorhamnose reductase [Sulfoacidibacillus ferrooxidans]|uniref:dTDP-4-dehydrorhamnose reductase n=1 Tax=Sulfoacidibacillus ferrooxidans TaxID=2005001 RepID=UPI001F513D2B|nr:dTDP-4-dehydrorhamnose reductase [Sulfoacidibacillus ferrooxidans]
MRIVVTGAQGQLGHEVVSLGAAQHEMIGLGRAQLDLTDAVAVREVLTALQPDVIIHAAAYTAVDAAESDVEQAFAVNAHSSRQVAMIAQELGARLCYVSTDYVFDGKATSPYREDATPDPQTVYGQSKWLGERLVAQLCARHFIVRTSWVYGVHGKNFVKTMLELATKHKTLRVVCDQLGAPTYTADLAAFLLELTATEQYGVYHASNAGVCSWYEFAKEIFVQAELDVTVEPCTSAEFVRPAPRPSYSVLDHQAQRTRGFSELRPWREGLHAFMERYRQTEEWALYVADRS